MKQLLNKKQYLGLFVVLTIICIFIVINFLRGSDIFSGKKKYYTVFNNVEGLVPTSPVYIRGLKVGTVESIAYDRAKDCFNIRFGVKSDYAIPSDSKAELYSADLLGGKSVRISMGTSNIHAKNHDTLIGTIIPDMMSLLSSEITPLKEQLSTVMTNLTTTLSSINTILDTNSQENLKSTFNHLHATVANTNKLTSELNNIAPSAKTMIDNLLALSETLKNNKNSIDSSLHNINTLSKNLADSPIDDAIKNINELISKIKSNEGTVGQLVNSDKIYKDVDSLVNNINNLIQKITENPKKYIKISVF